MKCMYKSMIILTERNNGRSFYFNEETVVIHSTPYRPEEELRPCVPGGVYLRGPRLGVWGGSLVVPYGAGLQNHLASYWLETRLYEGNIWLEKTEIQGEYIEVWFTGSGDLVSIELETELKKMLYRP